MYTFKQYVELFHLLFLSQLEKKLDKRLYTLKGGVNLRFFFKSIRYSEDIDFDVSKIAKDTLQNKVDKILENPAFQQNIRSKQLELIDFSKPKQTETTQRWKLSLKGENLHLPFPTKIEFSRRKMDLHSRFEPVDPNVIQSYGLYPIMTNHYTLQSAAEQKVQALIFRTETQARDIFDLKLLIDRGASIDSFSTSTKDKIKTAIDNALNIGFEEFKTQVVAFLMREYQAYYSEEKIWNQLQEEVIRFLEKVLYETH